MFHTLSLLPQTDSQENVGRERAVSVNCPEGIGQRIARDVRADSGFEMRRQVEVARIADGVSSDAVRAGHAQLVLVDQLKAARNEIAPLDRQNRLSEIRIQVRLRRQVVRASPNQA